MEPKQSRKNLLLGALLMAMCAGARAFDAFGTFPSILSVWFLLQQSITNHKGIEWAKTRIGSVRRILFI